MTWWPQSPRLTRRKVRPDLPPPTHRHTHYTKYIDFIWDPSGIWGLQLLLSSLPNCHFLLFIAEVSVELEIFFPQSLLSTGVTGVCPHIWLGQNSAECLQACGPSPQMMGLQMEGEGRAWWVVQAYNLSTVEAVENDHRFEANLSFRVSLKPA